MRLSYFKKHIVYAAVFIFLLLAVQLISSWFSLRWDLTSDGRYTLSSTTIDVLQKVSEPVVVEVLLSADISSSEFKKLSRETHQILKEYCRFNPNLVIRFTDPKDIDSETEKNWEQLGVAPIKVSSSFQDKISQQYVFPWLIIQKGDEREAVSLLDVHFSSNDKERIQNSVQRLEYVITDAIHRLFLNKSKKIAILRSNGTVSDIQMADFLTQLRLYYFIAPFSLNVPGQKTSDLLKQLKQFDLLMIAKPTQAFSEEQKFVIDQYIMQGGKVLWLVSTNTSSLEDLKAQGGKSMAMPLDLNLGDMFFSYGFRLNYNLIDDLHFTPIILAEGSKEQSRYVSVPWLYFPKIISDNNHLINYNLNAMRGRFMASIDTLANSVNKTILLKSSPASKTNGLPCLLQLDMALKLNDNLGYSSEGFAVSLLLEGEFSSMYKNRLNPVSGTNISNQSVNTKMIVISDGNFIKNDLEKNRPLQLGYDKWTGIFYDNKLFLQNCVQYLLNEDDFLSLRNRKVQITFIDNEKLNHQIGFLRKILVLYPILLVGFVFFVSVYVYKKSFGYKVKK